MATAQGNGNHRVAAGAGKAFLGRLGALIEVASLIAFGWAYGAETFGLYAALWSYVKVLSALSDVAMTTALQRFVPLAEQSGDHQPAERAGAALKLSVGIGIALALAMTALAQPLGRLINAGAEDSAALAGIIRLYVWTVPLWTCVESATAAIRARRTFGPEIKVRIFVEQGARLVLGLGFAGLGLMTFGLFAAHLVSTAIAGALALRLVSRAYGLRAVLRAPVLAPGNRAMLGYGLAVMPAALTKKLFSEVPVMALNAMLPGADGARAAGFYAIARKVASALQAVRLTFDYVMAPLAAERVSRGDRATLASMGAFATRIALGLALLLGATLIMMRHDLLALMRPDFMAAASAIVILVAGRVLEAATGPATALVEMLGHHALPALNSLAGLVVMGGLGLWLIPPHGLNGAAVAAAAGLNTTALLALWQTMALFRLNPYGRAMIRPLAVAGGLALLILLAGRGIALLGPPPGSLLVIMPLLLLSAMAIFIRAGLTGPDETALGRLGRLARLLGRRKDQPPETERDAP
ncbi:lipopolysaccharide biosynthesis protein [Yunchengibacter salinarum]|uniref:lipopolysaccharide biosynthesis protein n=1 Tax=Yunchengibacter salinarum TaxID=3133399 RepID=UPI0035B5F21C